MKIVLVHDDFIQYGGAERLFETITEIFPDSPIYTSLVDWDKLPKSIDKKRIRTSFIQKIPFAVKLYKILLPLYPIAFESFNFDNYDVVLSSTTRFAKSIITKPNTIHICYINSVPRFLWHVNHQEQYLPKFLSLILNPYFNWLRRWDKVSSSRVDFYIANSKNVQKSVNKIYQRETDVIYPFADCDYFRPNKNHPQNYFLIVSRLNKWKRIDIAIEAAKNLSIPLKVVGTGPDKERLKKISDGSQFVIFLDNISGEKLLDLYQNCKALIVTQEEDFGISAVEALACGRPIIAYAKGGQAEVITESKTGILFDHQTAQSLEGAIRAAIKVKWDINLCRKAALRFAKGVFINKLKEKVEEYASKPQ